MLLLRLWAAVITLCSFLDYSASSCLSNQFAQTGSPLIPTLILIYILSATSFVCKPLCIVSRFLNLWPRFLYSTPCENFTLAFVEVFHRSLSDNKSPQVSRTLVSIRADSKNLVVWTISNFSPIEIFFPVFFQGSGNRTNYNWYHSLPHFP